MLLCFIKLRLGNHYVWSRGFIASEPREPHPWSETFNVPNLTLSHLKWPGVSGSSPCTLTTLLATQVPSSSSSNGPNNYYVDNQGLVPWRLRRLDRSKVHSASLVKVLSDDKISWDPKSQLSWNLPPPTTQSNTCLYKKKRNKHPKEKAHLHQCTKSFPFPLLKHYWTDCSWLVCDEFRLIWECETSDKDTTNLWINLPRRRSRQGTSPWLST